MSSLLSDDNLLRLRANSHTTLRFAKSLQHATEHLSHPSYASMHQLRRLLLSSVPLAPSPTLYLSHFAPAHNAFCSLLALLGTQPLSQPLHNLLTHVAVHPHVAQLNVSAALSPKDAVALNFVRAVVACPPRIPIQLRNALSAMYTADKLHHIALVSSFGAFYSTLASLLGLADEVAASPDVRALDGELRHVLCHVDADADADVANVLEPSEMSLPTSTTYSRASSAFSFSNRLSHASKNYFFQRVAHPLRLKLACHSVHYAERTSWLASIPSTRRAQNDLLISAMGFVPEYLTAMRSQSPRSVFIYLVHSILLSDSPTVTPAIKNLACYILARSSENSVLTAHAAFLANRFGALDTQLSSCMDVPKLQAMQRAYALLDSATTSPTSSLMTLTDQQQHHSQLPAHPQPEPESARRSRRADRFRFPEFTSGVSFRATCASPSVLATDINHQQHGSDSDEEQLLFEDDSFVRSEPNLFRRGLAKLTRKDSDRRTTLKRSSHRPQPRYEHFDTPNSASKSHSCASSTRTLSTTHEAPTVDESVHSLFALSDNPQVPDVTGLNSFAIDEFDDFGEGDVQVEHPHNNYSLLRQRSTPDADADEKVDLSVFSREEVAFLLLAHEVVQASLHNSRICSKYADASPSPLISPLQATVMHKLLAPEAIMEQITVIATFGFLQRWLECYPYKPGALEAPVRRFAQSPIALSINLSAVGQRCDSRYAEDLREQTGRSLRLPRHAVAPRCDS
ncbi:unnamed protein product [Agarophyton chilense]|eukprot:gb/GEZJ01004656.1/.p1 GENE.gb/GEZJ01004656.1/~~gb/GEZJ01004656.1/.p1  ORF type:complete len:839 (+),score=106.42 gb/GEZJ01004656.1/:298-2517(+)